MATFFHANATIIDGTINNTVIGNTIPSTGRFTNTTVNNQLFTDFIDGVTASPLSIGSSLSTKIEIGKNASETEIEGYLDVVNYITANSLDARAVTTLSIGTVSANIVEISNNGALTRVQSALNILNSIDTIAAGVLALGGLTATAVEIGKTGATSIVNGNLNIAQNAVINGNLTINGTMTTINTQNLNIADSCITLNQGYIAEPAHAGCITVITDPAPSIAQTTVTTGGFTAAVVTTSGPTVVALTNVFTAGQIVSITGAANNANNGLYQFVSATGAGPFTLQFASNIGGTAPTVGVGFVQMNFTADPTASGTLTLTAVSVLHVSGAGVWGTATGSSAANFAAYRSIVGGSGASTDNAIARYDGVTGSLIQNSSIVVDDLNNMSGVAGLSATGAITLGGVARTVALSALGAVAIVGRDILTNATYNSNPAITGGLVTIYDPTTIQNAVAVGGFASSSTVVTNNAFTFVAGDIIQVVNAANQNNNGVYEVLSYAASTITIDTTPAESFSKNAFVVDTTAAGTITKVNVSHIRSGTDGNWEVAKGSATPLVYADLSSGLTGSGVTNRLTYWSSATSLTNAQIVVDSNNNINMGNAVPANGGRHIVKSYEAYSIGSAGAISPSANLDTSFVTITNATTCTGTLANGTFIGEDHAIVASSIFTGGFYNLTVTNYQPSTGAAGSTVLQFRNSGQSAHLVWNGTNWICINAGVNIL